jgi:hypothetical protein
MVLCDAGTVTAACCITSPQWLQGCCGTGFCESFGDDVTATGRQFAAHAQAGSSGGASSTVGVLVQLLQLSVQVLLNHCG